MFIDFFVPLLDVPNTARVTNRLVLTTRRPLSTIFLRATSLTFVTSLTINSRIMTFLPAVYATNIFVIPHDNCNLTLKSIKRNVLLRILTS